MHKAQYGLVMAAATLLAALPAIALSAPLPGNAPAIMKTAAPNQHPVFALATMDGKTFDLASRRGKWVIVNYWATWCPPCTKSLPAIAQFVAAHADVTAVGVAFMETSKQDVRTYLDAHPSPYPVAWMASTDSQQPFGNVGAMPTTYVIAPDGTQKNSLNGQFDAAQLLHLMQASGYVEAK